MNIVDGNINNLDELIRNKEVLVDFYATWCGPCKLLSIELDKIKEKIQIIKVDVDKNMELCKKYGIMNVPTLLHFKKDGTFDSNIGFLNENQIIEFINRKK